MMFESIFSGANISTSGLAGERLRMEVVANNIANASSTRTAAGGPFRRQEVIFATVLDQRLAGGRSRSVGPGTVVSRGRGGLGVGGMEVADVVEDTSAFQRVHNPGHPDADKDGYVTMPNVNLANEMVNLITASRAYEANLRSLQTFRQMSEQSLTLLRPQS